MFVEVLLGLIIVLLLIILAKVSGSKTADPRDIENAISETWLKLGLEQKLGAVENHAKDIRDSYKSFEQMLRVPKERAPLGEIALETILSDSLPPDMYGVRKSVLEGKNPDAHIKSTVGIICIDSKFALDNYANMVESIEQSEKDQFKKQFIKQVKDHLKKIEKDYVCPEKGSADFAFAYMPSESVYYFLITEAYDMLQEFTKKGVQVVSPLTLSHKIELIKAGAHAKKLSEEAETVKNSLIKLRNQFSKVDELWDVFYSKHFKNAENKANELDSAYRRLKEEFEEVDK